MGHACGRGSAEGAACGEEVRPGPSRIAVVPSFLFGVNAGCVVWLVVEIDALTTDLLALALVGMSTGVWLAIAVYKWWLE